VGLEEGDRLGALLGLFEGDRLGALVGCDTRQRDVEGV